MSRSPLNETLEQRLLRFSIQSDNGCIEWIGATYKKGGHGRLRYKYIEMLAHRAAYTTWVGEIPKGLCVCHYCDNPVCINPSHLWIGSSSENSIDRHNKGRTKWNKNSGDNGRNAKRDLYGKFISSKAYLNGMCGV